MKKYLENKHQEQRAQSLCLSTHASASQETIDHIHVGSFYELDHLKLPATASEEMKSIRVVMVNGKSLFKVSVSFPSLHSLQTHLNEESYQNPDGFLPAFDENYSMAPQIASEVLYRRIPHHEIAEQSMMWSFWAGRRRFATRKSPSPCCLSEIKLSGMVQWGKRKLVRCVTRHESLSSSDQEQPEKEETEKDEDVKEPRYEFRKRKLVQKKTKAAKRRKQNNQIVVHDRTQNQLVEASIERWTARRYKAAEENILKVMKAKGVCAENPIRRAPLRCEARKLIGDTGLIDHLLKHMAGKVAPGGADRFRRRHNADGALVYWLESADLMSVRKEAGVEDPYWTPPLGWKIGDNPTQDPTCVRMFKEIWEEIANVKREREFQQQEDIAMVTTSNSSLTTLDQGQAYSSVTNRKDKYTELAVRKFKIEEQMLQLSQSFSGIEEELNSLLEEMRVLKPTMEESAFVYSETAEVPMLISDIEGGTKDKMDSRDKDSIEDKAAKIERLRSSFRICKPQGTFLWPDTSASPKGVVQQTDSFLVPTPPSVSSSNKSATRLFLHTPNEHNLGSPLKPLAERRAVNTSTLSNVTMPPEKTNPQSQIDSISIGKTLNINLNEFPDAYNSDSTAIPEALTYQRKHQNMVKAKRTMEHDTDPGMDIMGLLRYNSKHQQRWCSSSFTSSFEANGG
ncbi:protein DYAD isoform X2 [Rosa chinensis]|uniref:protein DYAD isoform X2 n=1 Tax=Rosa chinensis TaxID=74649 RepID=UPI000D0877A9|nr:protein DYAD isoform X2 [Rosa chinensis]